jgi:hypothetical protein
MAVSVRPYTGHCLCGQVRYVAEGEPIHTGLCHCVECQRATSSAFAAYMCFSTAHVTMSGETKVFATTSGRGTQTRRNFCPTCSTIVYGGELTGKDINIYAGTLDEPDRFMPGAMVYTRSRRLWSHIAPGTLYEMEIIPGHES